MSASACQAQVLVGHLHLQNITVSNLLDVRSWLGVFSHKQLTAN